MSSTKKPKRDGWPAWTARVQEVSNEALARHLEDVVDEATTNFETAFALLTYDCESPIEALFAAAILPHTIGSPSYSVRSQHQIGEYRADFLVTLKNGSTQYGVFDETMCQVVVECDGHDFHERTKEQAERDKKRDRAIMAAGYNVMRFTGRELHRDAHACAQEVLDYTQRRLA